MRTDTPGQTSIAAWVCASPPLQIATVALGYMVCARFASTYALSSTGAMVLWLPNAVVLSALLLTRSSQWWKFGLTQIFSELLVDGSKFALLPSLGFALANLLEVLLSAWLIRRWCGCSFCICRCAPCGDLCPGDHGACTGSCSAAGHLDPLPCGQ